MVSMRRFLFLLALATSVIPAWEVRAAEAVVVNHSDAAALRAAPSQSPLGVADRRATSLTELLGRMTGSIDIPLEQTPPAAWFAAAMNLRRGGTRSVDSLQARCVRWQI